MNTRLGWGVTVILAVVIGAGEASAVDIDGKWGIGAGVFGGGGEVSLIRGRSERSAWLLELQLVLHSLASVVFMPSSGLGPKFSVAPAG
jgi:hypothetical protein